MRHVVCLTLIVAAILVASRRPAWQHVFQWLPVPLWCYAIPIAMVALGWLPSGHPAYRSLTDHLLPFALGLLLLGVDLPAVIRTGSRALIAMVVGAAGIMMGAPLGVWLLQSHVPSDAWKGAGALAGTWTGGTMNLLALRSILETPDTMFAPLIVVDAVIAYSWMALLVAASGFRAPINRWLRASEVAGMPAQAQAVNSSSQHGWSARIACLLIALALLLAARRLAPHLPSILFISSSAGWAVLLVTTMALSLSLIPPIRRLGEQSSRLGYACLYLVLAATGAQASFEALWSAPMWIVVGAVTALVHGITLLLAGRACRIPLGILATASQANIGGVVSAPLVGAVYDQSLAPVGLLLAMAGNALGTYLGLLSALICRHMVGHL